MHVSDVVFLEPALTHLQMVQKKKQTGTVRMIVIFRAACCTFQ